MKTKAKTIEIGGIRDLLPSWRISFMARNLSPNTVQTYLSAVEMLANHLTERGMPTQVASVRREHVENFLAWMTQSYKPSSVRNRYTGIRQFFTSRLLEEGEIPDTPLKNIPPPVIPENPPPILSDAQIRALLNACKGKDADDRRDLAIVSVFLDAGLRLGELVGLQLDDVDAETMTLTVLGKGRRPRTVALNRLAMQALDRYLRARRSHPRAGFRSLARPAWSDDALRRPPDAGAPRCASEGPPASFLISSVIHSLTRGSLAAGRRATSCGSLAGGLDRWLRATEPAQLRNERSTRIGG